MLASAPVISHIDASTERAVVSGTDLKVSQIAAEFERMGMSPDEIVEAHPHLTLASVHAALAFFYDNRAAIEAEWRAAEELIRELQAIYPRQRS